jgi:hypothetical protein
MLSIAYGYDVQETSSNQKDPMIKIATTAMDNFSHAMIPGAFLVNDIPFLMKLPQWLPGMGWNRLGKVWAKEYWDMVEVPYAFVKKEMVCDLYRKKTRKRTKLISDRGDRKRFIHLKVAVKRSF